MLITGNTRHRILDGNGKPVANGTILVTVESATGSEPAVLFRDLEFTESTENPIRLNPAGEIPFPVYVNKPFAWCFVESEDKIPVRNYPVAGGNIATNSENNATAQFTEILAEMIRTEEIIAQKAFIDDLTVSYSATIKNLESKEINAEKINAEKINAEKINAEEIEINGSKVVTPNVTYKGNPIGTWNKDKMKELFPIGSYICGKYVSGDYETGRLPLGATYYAINLKNSDGSEEQGAVLDAFGLLTVPIPNIGALRVRTCGFSGENLGLYYLCIVTGYAD